MKCFLKSICLSLSYQRETSRQTHLLCKYLVHSLIKKKPFIEIINNAAEVFHAFKLETLQSHPDILYSCLSPYVVFLGCCIHLARLRRINNACASRGHRYSATVLMSGLHCRLTPFSLCCPGTMLHCSVRTTFCLMIGQHDFHLGSFVVL